MSTEPLTPEEERKLLRAFLKLLERLSVRGLAVLRLATEGELEHRAGSLRDVEPEETERLREELATLPGSELDFWDRRLEELADEEAVGRVLRMIQAERLSRATEEKS